MTAPLDALPIVGDCGSCGAPMASHRAWAALSPEDRAVARALGRRRHQARGLCESCYEVQRRTGRLTVHQPGSAQQRRFVDAWQADTPVGDETQGTRLRRVSARLGMTFNAAEKALRRARQRGALAEEVPDVPVVPFTDPAPDDALTGGRWVTRRGVQRWEADEEEVA